MAYDQANTYETIELFGLTEKDAHLPIPEDHILKDSIIRETFETLLGQLRGTGLEAEIEPLAHGFATILQRSKVTLGKEVDRTADKIGALAKSHDGSEIAETALEEAQARFLQLREIVGAIEVMSEAAAECYEIETGHAFIPAAGSRASGRAQETGAVFEARQLLEQHDRETAAKSKVEGVPLIVSGATDWTDIDVIFNTLDKVRERIKQNRNQEIFLCHKAMTFTHLGCRQSAFLILLLKREAMMQQTLGNFGDARLEKGGPCFWIGWLQQAVTGFGSGGSGARGRARSGSRGFYAIRL